MAFMKLCTLPALALCVALVGCNDNKENGTAALMDDNESLAKQLEDKNARLNELGAQLQRERDRGEQLSSDLAACQAAAAGGEVPPAVVAAGDAKDFEGIAGVDARMQGNDLYLTIADSLLFDSGRTTLKDSSKRTLDQVAGKIKYLYPDRQVIVVGHTDADPIRKSTFATNYHLGFERAFRVREYLGKKGMVEQQMALLSYGPDHPQGSKERSRRVEIVVTDTPVTSAATKSASKTEAPRNAAAAASKAPAAKKTSTAKKPASPSK